MEFNENNNPLKKLCSTDDVSNAIHFLLSDKTNYINGANIVIKGTKVDGIYDRDPFVHEDAIKYNNISFDQVLKENLRVMDLTAITLCKENNLPIQVFDIKIPGALKKIVLGEPIGTIVSERNYD